MDLEDRIDLAISLLDARGECFITLPDDHDLQLIVHVMHEIVHGRGHCVGTLQGDTLIIRRVRWWQRLSEWRRHAEGQRQQRSET